MDTRSLAIALSAGRVLAGVGLVAAPSRAAAGWIGPEADLPSVQVVIRALGVRDLALGVGTIAAFRGGDPTPWVIAGIASDAVDLGATVAGGRSLPPTGRVGVALIAAAAAVTGTVVLRSLRS